MTKYEFKDALEELIFEYLHNNRNKKDLPHSISFDYTREDPNKKSYGELVFYGDNKDCLLKIKAIDYKDDE